LKLAWCPPGDFSMGSPTNEKGRADDEEQVHVTLTKEFWLGKHGSEKRSEKVSRSEKVRSEKVSDRKRCQIGKGEIGKGVRNLSEVRFPVGHLREENGGKTVRPSGIGS